MNLSPKRPFYANPGNAILEYGFVAILVLLVTLPGLYLAGAQLRQWLDGLKVEMASPRDRAIQTSQRVLEAKANMQAPEYYQWKGNLPTGDEPKTNPPSKSDRPQVSGSNGTKRNTPKNQPKRKTIVKKPSPPVEAEEEKKSNRLWCLPTTFGPCIEATGKKGVAIRLLKETAKADAPTKPANDTIRYLPRCSEVKSGPCRRPAAAKAEQKASTP